MMTTWTMSYEVTMDDEFMMSAVGTPRYRAGAQALCGLEYESLYNTTSAVFGTVLTNLRLS